MEYTLSDGGVIPAIGMGTWPMDDDEAARVIAMGIDMGYRMVDTAFAYGNEAGVGRGVHDSSVPREEIVITTKFNAHSHSVTGVAQAWEDSARLLGVDYIDLMLVHWPVPWQGTYVEAWQGLVALREQGKVRHIGVSSFLPEHLEPIVAATGVWPVLNQMQVNPRYLQPEARAYNAAHGIHTQAWSPLGQGTGLLEAPALQQVADKHGITPGQAVLAWNSALGMSTIPKSADPTRLQQNLDAVAIALDAEDIVLIETLDGTEPDIKHPNSFGH